MKKFSFFLSILFSPSLLKKFLGLLILGILLFLSPVHTTVAQNTVNQELAKIISEHHYLHPPLKQLLPLEISKLNTYLQGLDPYSQYFPPQKAAVFQPALQGHLESGLGINILGDEEQVIVVPYKQGPAYLAGLKHPQFLVSLNHKKISFNQRQSEKLPQLSPGTVVPIEVFKSLVRKTVKRYAVKAEAFVRRPAVELQSEEGIELIRIHEFRTGETSSSLKIFVNYLISVNKKIILDLRYSSGGNLLEAVDALSLFLPPSTPLITLADNAGYQKSFLATEGEKMAENQPIYLLVSPHTASSAEVFSLVLKHYARARVIGTATRGKCLSQRIFSFDNGSALKLSVYQIIGPDNRPCQGIGVIPDMVIEKNQIINTAFIINQGIQVMANQSYFVCVDTPYKLLKEAIAQGKALVSSVDLGQEKAASIEDTVNGWHYACVGPLSTTGAAEKIRLKLFESLGITFQIIVPFKDTQSHLFIQ
jgi:carboxyl-terminal processing protease